MNSKQTSDLLKTAERRAYVLQLRKGGATYDAIAQAAIDKFGVEHLPAGYDCRYVWKDVRRELDRLRAEIAESSEAIVTLEEQRLDAMITVLWPQVAKGNQGAVDRVLRIMERRAKLLGLDAPTKADVTSGGQPLTFRVVYDRDERSAFEDDADTDAAQ